MKNILVLSDFSSYSKNATSYAMQLFQDRSVHFYFLNIVKVWDYTTDDLMTGAGQEVLYDTILKSSKQSLKKKVDLLQKRYSEQDFEFTALTDYDVFTDAINQAVKQYDIECVIMGSDGKSDFMEGIFGSHSTRVLRNVSCPILVVPDEYQYAPAQHLLIVLDEGRNYTSSMFNYAFKLFYNQPLTASILRLCNSEPIHLKEELATAAADFKQRDVPYFKLSDKSASKGELLAIVDQAVRADINMVSIQPKPLVSRLFKQSPIASIIAKIEKPTLFLTT